MKTYFRHSYLNKVSKSLLTFSVVFVISFNSSAQLTFTEDFENETTPSGTPSHTFTESGMSFSSTIIFASLPQNYGYGASPKYIYITNTTNSVPTSGVITITAGKPIFKINSFAAYIGSDIGGSTPTNGTVTFVGTLLGGGTASATITIPSLGTVTPPLTREANDVVNGLSFTGTALDGVFITSLTVNTSATVQFIELDHINFTVDNTPPTITCPANIAVCGAALVPAVNVGSVTATDNFAGVVTVTHVGDVSTPSTTVPYTILRTYRATDVSGNFAECTQTITVNPIPTATASSNSPVCTGATIQLTGTGVGTYLWTGPNGATTTQQNPQAIAAPEWDGTYTFIVTDANGCTATATTSVTVNPSPATPTLLDTGTALCAGSSSTLTAPAGYTSYAWERSLTGIATPNSFTAFGGTAQTQVVTTSGFYRVVVGHQINNCLALDTMAVAFGDIFSGSLGAGDAQQTGRMARNSIASTCAAPKSFPGNFSSTDLRFYDTHTVTNPSNVAVCATIGLTSGCGNTIFSAAYLNSYNPASFSTNYLTDAGNSPQLTKFYDVSIPANGTIVIVVHEVNPNTGCSGYTVRVNMPLQNTNTITGTIASPTFIGRANQHIVSTGKVIAPAGAIDFKAPNSITLNPGFEAVGVSNYFKAQIGVGCVNP